MGGRAHASHQRLTGASHLDTILIAVDSLSTTGHRADFVACCLSFFLSTVKENWPDAEERMELYPQVFC